MSEDIGTDEKPEAEGPRLFQGLTALANVLATLWIIVLMLLVVADVAGRNLFLAPIAGVPEIVKYSIVGIVFLQIAHTHAHGRMIRSDGLLMMLAKRHPRISALFDFIAQLAGCGLTIALAWAVIPRLQKAWDRGEYEGALGHFVLPVWPFYTIIVIGSMLLAFSFLLAALRAAHRMRMPTAPEGASWTP